MEPEIGTQLELFRLLPSAAAPRKHLVLGAVQIRYDHVVLGAMIGLIGVSVVFAAGVERGSRAARADQYARMAAHATDGVSAKAPRARSPADTDRVSTSSLVEEIRLAKQAARATATRESAKPSEASRRESGTPAAEAFAIQVVSYSQPRLAKQELERLTQRGEPAFLMEANQLTILCVGPFATRERAKAKLTTLRQRYRDCFVRSL